MSATDLKAHAYDILAQIQFLQGELARINKQIAEELARPSSDNKAD
jgi:hypothetical protein